MPATLPADIVNRALDEIGVEAIGDLDEGSKQARAAIRIYDSILRQLLSAAHWNFARFQFTLALLGDASGILSTNTDVPSPWGFMYEWPVDCVNARFVPRTDPQGATLAWASPAPFLITSYLRPNEGQWYLVEGHDPESTRVILTNQVSASLVYTRLMQYPDAWDPLFQQAMVAVLAARLAMPLVEDKKLALALRRENVEMAKGAIDAARIRDGNEGWTVNDHTPDWIRARTGSGWGVPGMLFCPWTAMPFVEDAGGVY